MSKNALIAKEQELRAHGDTGAISPFMPRLGRHGVGLAAPPYSFGIRLADTDRTARARALIVVEGLYSQRCRCFLPQLYLLLSQEAAFSYLRSITSKDSAYTLGVYVHF